MILKRRMRHILVKSSRKLEMGDARNGNELKDQLLQFLGERGFADAGPRITRIIGNDTFIMSCTRGSEQNLVLALSFVKKIGNENVGFYTIKTSGTIKSLMGKEKGKY